MNEIALIVGWVVLASAAIIGTVTLVMFAWWYLIDHVVAPQIAANELFFTTAARILKERRATREYKERQEQDLTK